jgi:hypothetical protein
MCRQCWKLGDEFLLAEVEVEPRLHVDEMVLWSGSSTMMGAMRWSPCL